MLACVIRIDSKSAAGDAFPLRVSSHDDADVCHLNGEQWEPAIARMPLLRYDFFGGDFSGNITAPRSSFQIAIDGIDSFNSRVFAGARVRIWTGTLGNDFGSYTLRFDGRCTAEPAVREMIATFNVSVDDSALDEPLLGVYAGTGTTEGPDDLTGIVKPLLLGNVEYGFGRLINAVDLVYQVSDGAVEAVNSVYDRGKSLGASTGDYADYATLVAASIPAGGWGSCKALGLVRLGAPPDGAPAFSVSGDNGGAGGYVRKPGAIIARIAEIVGASTDAANIAAFDAACPYNLQIDLYQQTTARDVIQTIADSVGGVAGVTWTGKLFVQALAIDTSPTVTLAADGTSDLAVAQVSALPVSQPFWRLATEAEPTYVVLSPSEVATGYNFRGAYSSAREYRLDDLVYADDGRAFVYINATPGSGNAPPTAPTTSNAYWSLEGAADNTATSQITLGETSAISVQANSEGETTTTLPAYRTVQLFQGGSQITSGVTVGTVTSSGGITASASVSSGDVEVEMTAADASGTIVVPVIYNGVTYTKTITVNRTIVSDPVGGGSGSSTFTDYIITDPTSTTYATVSDAGAIVQSDSSGELKFTFFGNYFGDGAVVVKAGYSTDDVSYTDVTGSETTGSAASVSGPYPLEGAVGFTVTQTGLTANTDYYVRLQAKFDTGVTGIAWNQASFNVKQP